jgi:hypothetical protein
VPGKTHARALRRKFWAKTAKGKSKRENQKAGRLKRVKIKKAGYSEEEIGVP